MTNLEVLYISCGFGEYLDLSKLIKLKELNVAGKLEISEISTLTLTKIEVGMNRKLLEKLPISIKKISFHRENISLEENIEVLKRFTNLKRIHFQNTDMNDAQINIVLDGLPNVKKITLNCCHCIVGTFLEGRNIKIKESSGKIFDSKYLKPNT
jgi:hypothetical protein